MRVGDGCRGSIVVEDDVGKFALWGSEGKRGEEGVVFVVCGAEVSLEFLAVA